MTINFYLTYSNSIFLDRVRAPSEISTPETKVSVPPAISCLMFYVYLCPNCLLEIYTSEESIPTWIANSGSMTKNVLFKSQEVLIEVNTTLRLVRRTSGSPGKTYWGIDIRQCPNVKLNKSKPIFFSRCIILLCSWWCRFCSPINSICYFNRVIYGFWEVPTLFAWWLLIQLR
mgnify:CR=1 FL=1